MSAITPIQSDKKIAIRPSGRVIARFSCGAASAVATKMAIRKYGAAVDVYYADTGSEHPDNERFMLRCERWFGAPINVVRSDRYRDTWDCYERRRFLVGPSGFAVCAHELKIIPGDNVWNVGDVEIYGYTIDERRRLTRWREHNTERIIECPLIDMGYSKDDCLGILDRAGIEIPEMYRLGFRNNNCLGCVKARDNINYWKRIRMHFPSVFERMAALERDLDTTINRATEGGERSPIYLDQIPPGGPGGQDLKISCGLFCMAAADDMSGDN